MDIKREIDRNTVIVGNFNTPLISMDRSSRQKINKEKAALNDTLGQMDSVDIYRSFHPKAAKYTFFSSVYGSFSKIDNMLGHKITPNKFKKIEIMSSIFSDHNGMKLWINLSKTTQNHSNI